MSRPQHIGSFKEIRPKASSMGWLRGPGSLYSQLMLARGLLGTWRFYVGLIALIAFPILIIGYVLVQI